MNKLIVDTNLLLLIVIGAIDDGKHIKNSKRLNNYNEKDYQTVLEFISHYDEVFITPYIATEVSNLIDLDRTVRDKVFEFAREFFKTLTHIASDINNDSIGDSFIKYGLTDNSLIRLVNDYHILTNDGRLCEYLVLINQKNVIPYSIAKKVATT
jgi:rRNA-processing protein FCF1